MVIMSHELKLRSDCQRERVIRSAVHEYIMKGEVAIDEASSVIQRELGKLGIGLPQILDKPDEPVAVTELVQNQIAA